MDVHSTSHTLCCYSINDDQYRFIQTISPNIKSILNYLDTVKEYYGEGTEFICGYEAGCLGYSLCRTMTKANFKCIILAPTSIPEKSGNKWTQKHFQWIKSLEWNNELQKETLEEYLRAYEYNVNNIERIDSRIEEIAQQE